MIQQCSAPITCAAQASRGSNVAEEHTQINLAGDIFVAAMTSAVLPSFGPIEFLLPPA
jgi:hypothetical protein